jgi:NhaA family Na+:H+ antiporter
MRFPDTFRRRAWRPIDIRRVAQPFQDFAARGVLGGFLLVTCGAVALVWANLPGGESYFRVWETPLAVRIGPWTFAGNLHLLINDGLMAVFFLLVGLEIKRELLVGELSSRQQALLPIVAAAGGMIVPALIYVTLNIGGPGIAGWGIPIATDIAFALGALTLLGPRVPVGLKVFLTALAIADDIGAVLVIALFYAGPINLTAIGLASVAVLGLVLLSRARVTWLTPYVVLGLILWAAMLTSGVHATLAGVILAFAIPARTRVNAAHFSEKARGLLDDFDRSEGSFLLVLTNRGQQEAIHALELASTEVQAPLLRLEHRLHGAITFGILPLFALANAGVHFSTSGAGGTSTITSGVAFGLLVGKPAGILIASWLAVRLAWARLPAGASWPMLHGVAWLGGIGFTMSLFVAGLAFPDPARLDAAKIGILVGSAVAATVGCSVVVRESNRVARSAVPEELPPPGEAADPPA